MEKFIQLLILKNLPGVGKVNIYKKYWGLLQDSLDEQYLRSKLNISGLAEKNHIDQAYNKALKEYETVKQMNNISVITVFDKEYPEKLSVMENKRPLYFYVKGNKNIISNPNIAVIGTRKPSLMSQEEENKLVRRLHEISNRIVVSGLALGCDQIAHKVTVEKEKQTIAVLPCGLNRITPAVNKILAEDIVSTGGCLISEYEPDEEANKGYYIERDAFVAALSDIIFVMECGIKSGTMHTVDRAFEYKRLLGSYYPKDLSRGDYSGNEHIIKNKSAVTIADADEIGKLLTIKKEDDNHQMTLDDFLNH
jgi:Predicted Rossmann fold nucleotide-binding protein involved in DNA uptake